MQQQYHLESGSFDLCTAKPLLYEEGQSITVDDKYFSPFRTSTKPEAFIDEQEIEKIKVVFMTSIDQLQTDFDNKIFGSYSPSENILRVYGVELHSIDDALESCFITKGITVDTSLH